MIVECPSCQARYNLSPALIGGSRGARVRCRKCGDRFEVRNPEMPPPTEAVESPRMGMEPDKEPRPPEPSHAPAVDLKVPGAGDSLSSPQHHYRERKSYRSGRWKWTHPAGSKAAYLLAGSIGIVLGITVARLVPPELHWGLTSVPDNTLQDVSIISSHYTMSSGGVKMFVIQGSVRDIRKGEVSAPIRLRAKLFDAKKGVLAEKTFLAGSDIPETGIPADIYYLLHNTSLKKGWLPFVVVFVDTGVIADFSVTIEPM